MANTTLGLLTERKLHNYIKRQKNEGLFVVLPWNIFNKEIYRQCKKMKIKINDKVLKNGVVITTR